MTYSQHFSANARRLSIILQRLRWILAIPICLLAIGCTQKQIVYQALSHHKAISSSADQILLTNILRASYNLATDYTAISDYKAEAILRGSISPKLPFGSDAASTFSIDPTLNISPGITSITVTNFGQQDKSYKNLHKPTDKDDLLRRMTAGWDSRLVETFLFSRIL